MEKIRWSILLFFLTVAILLLSFFVRAKFILGQQKIVSPLAVYIPTPISTPKLTSPTPIPTDTPIPTPSFTPVPTANPQDDSIWDSLAACESNGNWADDTGNGYFGGLQFNQTAWESVGGSGKPSSANREEQIAKGKLLQQMRGWEVWANCARKLGLY